MRTFLPFSDFRKCAECFTTKRLTKQRHDVLQILYMLSGRSHPTIADRFMYNSPPKKVWCQIPYYLLEYGYALCDEYARRTGKPDPLVERLDNRKDYFNSTGQDRERPFPNFLSSEAMHKSHRAILAREDAKHYAKFGFERCPDDEKVFYWPVEEAQAQYDPRAIDEERRRERDRRNREDGGRNRYSNPSDDDDRPEDEDDDDGNETDDWSGALASESSSGLRLNDEGDCDCEACRRERDYANASRRNLDLPPLRAESYPVAIERPWLVPADPVPAEAVPADAPATSWNDALNSADFRSFEQYLMQNPRFLAEQEPEPVEDSPGRGGYGYVVPRNSWGDWTNPVSNIRNSHV